MIVMLLLATIGINAQKVSKSEFEPTVNWPYLLDDFYMGRIFVGNDTVSDTRLNFHMRSEAIQCIDKSGNIARIIFPNISRIVVGDKTYRLIDGKPMLQIAGGNEVMVMEYRSLDYDLFDNGYMQGVALYARQNSDHVMKVNWNPHVDYKSIPMPGEFNESYAEMRTKWFDGQQLPVKTRYIFVIDGQSFHATLSDCNDRLNKDGRKQLKEFIKSQKLKWNKPLDLFLILQKFKLLKYSFSK